MSSLIEASGITRDYHKGSTLIHVLKGLNISVDRGEFIAIMGPSGSGKSTLMHILGCLQSPTSGRYLLDGMDVFSAPDRVRSSIRANHIGFVFQTFNLIPQLNVYENVELPLLYSDIGNSTAEERVLHAVDQVGLKKRINHKPGELSGGEMQRVAIARAIAINPSLVLADEPTGNLDSATGLEIMKLFKRLHDDGATIVLITHDSEVASHAQRRIYIKDGLLTEEKGI